MFIVDATQRVDATLRVASPHAERGVYIFAALTPATRCNDSMSKAASTASAKRSSEASTRDRQLDVLASQLATCGAIPEMRGAVVRA